MKACLAKLYNRNFLERSQIGLKLVLRFPDVGNIYGIQTSKQVTTIQYISPLVVRVTWNTRFILNIYIQHWYTAALDHLASWPHPLYTTRLALDHLVTSAIYQSLQWHKRFIKTFLYRPQKGPICSAPELTELAIFLRWIMRLTGPFFSTGDSTK